MTAPGGDLVLQDRDGFKLTLTLNNPAARNALSAGMVEALGGILEAVRNDRSVRCIVLRGAGGNFCAGGDIKGFGASQAAQTDNDAEDPMVVSNRRYGQLLDAVNEAPQAVIAAIEGAVRGGGMGFSCTADIAIATERASFGLPEATLGLPASQVCVFVAQRIGLTETRRLAVTGASFRAPEALRLGLIHHVVPDADALAAKVDEVAGEVKRCAPEAVAEVKRVLHLAGRIERAAWIDSAAQGFAAAMRGEAAREGVAAFIEKRPPAWTR